MRISDWSSDVCSSDLRASDSYPTGASPVPQPQGTYTETGWEVFPQGLTELLLWFKQAYGDIPLYVTENCAAFFDPPVADVDASGARRVRDQLRTDYLRKHLSAIHDRSEEHTSELKPLMR